MRVIKRGFTLIEVSLFLAITGLLFVGITVGVQNSIYQQRFNDSVQSFVEFLRSEYSEVTNVQGLNGGRSDKAVYGRLIIFGQNIVNEDDNPDRIYSYGVIGDANPIGGDSILQSLINANVDIVYKNGGEASPNFSLAGITNSFLPKWTASIERRSDYERFVGALLIVRSPGSGIVHTYVLENETINVNEILNNNSLNGKSNILIGSGYLNESNEPSFKLDNDVDFCVNPDPGSTGGVRRDVHISSDAKNSAAITILSDDANKCVR